MTNREKIAWSFEEYDNSKVAMIVSDMLDEIGLYMDRNDVAKFERWLGLECDGLEDKL